jgi:hypothetical protein
MDGFNKLQELGSKTISSATHIPVAHVESILNKKFEKFQRPQFFGFLSILEREYKVDLSGLKQEFLFARAEKEITQESNLEIADTSSKLFEKKKAILKNKKVQYVIAGSIVALLVFILISVVDFSSTTVAKIEINNTAIDQAKKNLNLKPVDVSNVEDMMQNNEVESAEFGQDTQEANGSISKDETIQESKNATDTLGPVSSNEPVMPLYLRIIPKGKLWLGICQIIDKEEFKARNGGKLW